MSNSDEIQDFIQNVRLVSEEHHDILVQVRTLFIKHYKKLDEAIKYNGVTFNLGGQIIGGIYPSKRHVSLEFSNGANLTDSEGILEGSGKKRRHIKLVRVSDIKEKKVDSFIKAIETVTDFL